MECEEAQELITAWIDNELSAGERIGVEGHLKNCPACSREFERESVLKRRIRLAGLQVGAPPELRRLIEEQSAAARTVKEGWSGWSLRGRLAMPQLRLFRDKNVVAVIKEAWSEYGLRDRFALPRWRRTKEESVPPPAGKKVWSGWTLRGRLAMPGLWPRGGKGAALARLKKGWSECSFRDRFRLPNRRRNEETGAVPGAIQKAWRGWSLRAWLALPTWRRALISAVLVSIVALVLFNRAPEKSEVDFIDSALDLHASILSGKTTLLHAVNLAAMRKELAYAVGDRFRPVVLDLSTMNVESVSGFVRNIRGREMLATVYELDGPTITCFTFLGSGADAPKGAEQFYDSNLKVNFYSFSRDGLNAVLHRDGDVMCLLVSRMAPAELLALVRGKSAHG